MSTSWSSWTTPIAPEHAYVPHARQLRRRGQPLPQARLDPLDLGPPVLAEQQVDRGVGDGGGQRIAHEGRAVREHRHLAPRDPLGHPRRAQRRRHRHIAAGQRLAHAHHVRRRRRRAPPRTARPCARTRSRSRRTPAARRARRTPRAAPADSAGEWNRIPPAPCTTGSTITAASSSACRPISSRRCAGVRLLVRRAGRRRPRTPAGAARPPQLVHPALRVAHRHRLPGVAVVAAAPGQQPLLAPGGPANASTAGTS